MNIKVNRPNSNHEKNDLFFLIALLSGYIIVCALPSIFRVESRDFAVPYRFFMFFLVVFITLIYISRQFFHLESAFIERNYLWIFEGNTSGREPYFNRAIAIFKDNILVGGRVLYEDGMYPHNLFLELLMSGGILLLIIFGLIFYPLIKNINYFLNVSNSKLYILPLFALWLQYLILVQTSYNIHSNPEFWYFSSVIIGISIKNHNEKT